MRVKLFTDGSSDFKKGLIGAGAVVLDNDNNILSKVSKSVDRQDLKKYNNVAGEIIACCYGIEECIKLGATHVTVYVDFINLIKWYDGSFRTNTKLSQLYVQLLRQYRTKIDFDFVKVKGHSNNEYNDMADELAKKSIGK